MIRIYCFTKKSLLPLFTAFVFLLTGCENFLKSEDVKKEIVDTIEYNNEFVSARVHTGSAHVSPSWNGWHTILTDEFIRPSNSHVVLLTSFIVAFGAKPLLAGHSFIIILLEKFGK